MNCLVIFLVVLPSFLGNPVPGLPKSGIVGGKKATSIPYQVSIERFEHSCGGSIVSPRFVVTAAHCMTYRFLPFWVRAGSNNRNEGGQLVRVSDYVIHPKFNITTIDYDIAILMLSSPLQFNSKVHSIPMAKANDSLKPGTLAAISGWGYEREDAAMGAYELMLAKVPIVKNETCKYSVHEWSDRKICAGYDLGGIDACFGDSGGPLVAYGKLFGIVSSGQGCANKYSYATYMSIPAFRLWIDESILYLKNKYKENWKEFMHTWLEIILRINKFF